MIRLDQKSHSNRFILFIWFLMAFQAGYVNSGGFITANSFVSHVTGFGTQIGMSLGKGDFFLAFEFLSIPFFFILGAYFSSINIGNKILRGQRPNYILVSFVKSLVFGFVLYAGLKGIFGEFNTAKTITDVDFFIIPLLCFACGIQNSTCSQSTNGFLKPTHLTGLSTDIGIHFGRLHALKANKDEAYKEEKRKNLIRLGIFASFSSGAAVSFLVFKRFEYMAFVFPFVTSVIFLLISVEEEIKNNKNHMIFKYVKVSIFVLFFISLASFAQG